MGRVIRESYRAGERGSIVTSPSGATPGAPSRVRVVPFRTFPDPVPPLRRLRLRSALFALVTLVAGCEHFAPYKAIPEATGPIATGDARIRIENTSSVTITETWYSACLGGGESPLKVPRTIRPGESTQQDVPAGCTRLTMYHATGAYRVTVTAPAGEVTTVVI